MDVGVDEAAWCGAEYLCAVVRCGALWWSGRCGVQLPREGRTADTAVSSLSCYSGCSCDARPPHIVNEPGGPEPIHW